MRLVPRGPSEHISYFILNICSALTGVDSVEIVGGDEEFPWKEEGRRSLVRRLAVVLIVSMISRGLLE